MKYYCDGHKPEDVVDLPGWVPFADDAERMQAAALGFAWKKARKYYSGGPWRGYCDPRKPPELVSLSPDKRIGSYRAFICAKGANQKNCTERGEGHTVYFTVYAEDGS